MSAPDYIFHNTALDPELERLRLIEKAFDPITERTLDRLALSSGASCLEIGPGAGSVLTSLVRRVGPHGRVTAIDLDTRFVAPLAGPTVTVLQDDITRRLFPDKTFDLVHARYVLIHLQDVPALLTKLCRTLKPGGWLLLEEPDFSPAQAFTADPVLNTSFLRVREAIRRMYDGMSLDPRLGGRLADFMTTAGLGEVGHETSAERSPGGSVIAEMMKRSALHLKDRYVKTGAVTETDIAHYARLAEDPQASAVYYAHVSAWGRAV